jgi:hypothetical protein
VPAVLAEFGPERGTWFSLAAGPVRDREARWAGDDVYADRMARIA